MMQWNGISEYNKTGMIRHYFIFIGQMYVTDIYNIEFISVSER